MDESRVSRNTTFGISQPATQVALWDSRSTGETIQLGFSKKCKIEIHLEETTLRLLQRFSEQKEDQKYQCGLVGAVAVQEGCVVVHVERLCESNSDHSPGEVFIPCTVHVNSARPLTTEAHIAASVEELCKQSFNSVKCDLGNFLATHVLCGYHSNRATSTFHLDVNLVTFSTRITLTPINAVPIVPTALSKNLTGPMGLINPTAEPKSGFLTMDQTRRLLLVLESDPKSATLPLVGVWVGSVSGVDDARVWACCMRYTCCKLLRGRMKSPPDPFLLLVYTTERQRPFFYQCIVPTSQIQPCLLTGHEVIQLHKGSIGELPDGIDVDMLPVQDGPKSDLFTSAVKHTTFSTKGESGDQERADENKSLCDDAVPRTQLRPHKLTGVSLFESSVPEVSLLFEESQESPNAKPTVVQNLKTFPSIPNNTAMLGPAQQPVMQSSSMRPAAAAQHSPLAHAYTARQSSPSMARQSPVAVPHAGPPPRATASRNAQLALNPHASSRFRPPMRASKGHVNAFNVQPANYATQSQGYNPVNGARLPSTTVHQPQQYSNQSMQPAVFTPNAVSYDVQPAPYVYQSSLTTDMPPGHQVPLLPGGAHPPVYHPAHNPQMRPLSKMRQSERSVEASPQVYHAAMSRPVPSAGSPSQSTSSGSVEASPVRNSGSTDSGLHVETLNDSSEDSLSSNPYPAASMSNSHIPVEVLTLLKTQDQQLQELRQQLAQLMAKQASSEAVASPNAVCDSATQSSGTVTPGDEMMKQRTRAVNSVAINTSLWLTEASTDHDTTASSANTQVPNTPHNTSQQSYSKPGQKNAESSRPVPMYQSSPLRPDQYPGMSTIENESLSLGEINLTSVQEPTEDSYVSQMIVDIPAYTSLSPDKLERRSWGSSHCSSNSSHGYSSAASQQQSDDDGSGEVVDHAADVHIQNQKAFYENLIGNVRRFLGQHDDSHQSNETQVADNQPDVIETESPPPSPSHHHQKNSVNGSIDVRQMTQQQLCQLGVDLDFILNRSQVSNVCEQSAVLLDAAMLPKVNYQTLWLDGTDSEGSTDFDALAMKYLSDEQLSELARLQMTSNKTHKKRGSLDGLLDGQGMCKSDVSTIGLPLNHMSFASKKYLERYGLLGDAASNGQTSVPASPSKPSSNKHIHQFLQVLAENNNISLTDSESNTAENDATSRHGANQCKPRLVNSAESKQLGTPTRLVRSRVGCVEGSSDSSSVHSTSRSPRTNPTSPQNNKHPPKLHDKASPSPNQVLDIKRLRELPKLM